MREQVTIIPEDKVIVVDGHGINFDFTVPENIHAIQWYGKSGHYEYNDDTTNKIITTKDYPIAIEPYVLLWEEQKNKLEKEFEDEYNRLDNVKARKYNELNIAFDEIQTNTAWITSSLGFKVDANTIANTNVEGLIRSMTSSGEDEITFCDYDNIYRQLTLDDLKVIQLEITKNGQNLYAQKWAYRNSIDTAVSNDEVNTINIVFTMMDFSVSS